MVAQELRHRPTQYVRLTRLDVRQPVGRECRRNTSSIPNLLYHHIMALERYHCP